MCYESNNNLHWNSASKLSLFSILLPHFYFAGSLERETIFCFTACDQIWM
jgi:hypothetical protein